MSFVKNIRLLTCRWARPMLARELMRVWQQTAEGHVPWLQRRVGALRAATRAERTGLHRRRTDLQPQGPDPEREREGDTEGCAWYQVALREGSATVICCFYRKHRHPLLTSHSPQPRWTFAASSLFPKVSQKSNYTHTHRVLPADSVCGSSFWRISEKPSGGWDESGWRGLIQSWWPCTLSTCWPITVNGALKTTKIRQGLCGP